MQADTFHEQKYSVKEAASKLHVSQGTMRNLLKREMLLDKTGLSHLFLGKKRAQGTWTICESALRRIYNRIEGGYYSKVA